MNAALMRIPCEVAPFSLSGTVYGTLLNHRSALEAVAGEAGKPPYNALPRAPVLYLKPRNTLAADGDPVEIPAGIAELEAAACLGIVIGRTACRVSEATALDHVAGFLIVNDVSVPHSNYFRPAVRYQARDGFCPLGPRVTPRALIAHLAKSLVDIWLASDYQGGRSASKVERMKEIDAQFHKL